MRPRTITGFLGRPAPALALATALAVQGCAGGVSTRDVSGFDNAMARGDYNGAAQLALGAGQIGPDGNSKNLLWSLDAGAALVHAGQGARTIPVLDHAELMMKAHDATSFDTSGQYHAKTYDGVMVNAYKAIAAMEAGDTRTARTELLRADDRQRRAEEEFQKDAAAVQAKENANGVDLRSAMKSAQNDPTYRAALRDMDNYGGYAPFVNPFATYLTGLYFLNATDRDPERARNAFQKVRGIVGNSELLSGDYALAEGSRKFTPKTWVIFENGQGSTLAEYLLSIANPDRWPPPGRERRASCAAASAGERPGYAQPARWRRRTADQCGRQFRLRAAQRVQTPLPVYPGRRGGGGRRQGGGAEPCRSGEVRGRAAAGSGRIAGLNSGHAVLDGAAEGVPGSADRGT